MVENQAFNEKKNCSTVRPLDNSELSSLGNTREPDRRDALCLLSVYDWFHKPGHNYSIDAGSVEMERNSTLSIENLGKWTALTRLQDNFKTVGHQDGWDETEHLAGKAIVHDEVPRYVVSRQDLERIAQKP